MNLEQKIQSALKIIESDRAKEENLEAKRHERKIELIDWKKDRILSCFDRIGVDKAAIVFDGGEIEHNHSLTFTVTICGVVVPVHTEARLYEDEEWEWEAGHALVVNGEVCRYDKQLEKVLTSVVVQELLKKECASD